MEASMIKSEMSDNIDINKKIVAVFDFDGVLAIPWSQPAQHYKIIPSLLKEMYDSGKYIICCASYNPSALKSIERWGLLKYFTCVRCGANFSWHGPYEEHYRIEMQKSSQITDMIKNEIKELNHDFEKVYFYDDDKDNINLVNRDLPTVNTVLIDPVTGLLKEHIK